jgi:hypothetical protein
MDTPLLNTAIGASPPRELYHYTSIEGLRGIITSKQIWASAAQYLNDAKEFRLAIDIAREYLRTAAHVRRGQPVARLLDYCHDQLERLEHYLVCVFSLSEEPDLLSQWRGYCPPGGGYAIGFPGNELKALLARQGCWLARCVYAPAAHRALVAEALDPVVGQLPNEGLETEEDVKRIGELWMPGIFHRVSRVAPLIKHESFQEEHEWRVIWIPAGQRSRYQYRPSRSMFIPYVPIDLSLSEGQMVLGEILVGPMPHQYIATNGLTGFLTQQGAPWKGVRPSQIPFRTW